MIGGLVHINFTYKVKNGLFFVGVYLVYLTDNMYQALNKDIKDIIKARREIIIDIAFPKPL